MHSRSRPAHGKSRVVGRRVLAAGLAAAAAVALAGCSGSEDSPSSSQTGRGDTLTVGTFFPFSGLNPQKVSNPSPYMVPIFAPLIRRVPSGELEGVLAESWEYVDDENKVFQITLRSGAEFSDGSAVTPDAVAESIKQWMANSGSAWVTGCDDVVAESDSVVQVTCEEPNPELAYVLSDYIGGGMIIAPASLDNPDTLDTAPIGAGPYILDNDQTVSGSSYTYVPNEKYFDQDAIHWDKLVIKPFDNPNTLIAAMNNGEVQYANFFLDAGAMAQAQSDGLDVSTTGFLFSGVLLADREESADNPMGSVEVRQALNYALDRPAITEAVYGEFGTPTTQIGIPGEPTTWDESLNDAYPYDVDKAKELLADAGYADGFTVKVEDQPQSALMTQAVCGAWEEIGVTCEITQDTPTSLNESILSQEYPGIGYVYGGLPMFLEARNFFQPISNIYNPFVTDDPAVQELIATAAAAPADEQEAAWQAVQAYGVEQAWYAGVAISDIGAIAGEGVEAPPANGSYLGSVLDVTPA